MSGSAKFPNEIGGYFELGLPDYGDPFPNTFKFQSGRAALRAALESAGIKRIHIPDYICNAVVQAIADAGVLAEGYRLDDSLYPKTSPDVLERECAFLYVNYFGLCQENVDRLLQYFPRNQLIIDNSQALLAQPGNAMATIYSVRKYVGVPDGGLLAAPDLGITMPENEDTKSIDRMRPLLVRTAYSARNGYLDYVESEKTLTDTKPLRISRLTNRLMRSIDMNTVTRRRRENFFELARHLDKHNVRKWTIDNDSVPLCYPLLLDWDVTKLKETLHGEHIFVPSYWPEAKARTTFNSIEYNLTQRCLFVPCDQRYTISQITELAEQIISSIEDSK